MDATIPDSLLAPLRTMTQCRDTTLTHRAERRASGAGFDSVAGCAFAGGGGLLSTAVIGGDTGSACGTTVGVLAGTAGGVVIGVTLLATTTAGAVSRATAGVPTESGRAAVFMRVRLV